MESDSRKQGRVHLAIIPLYEWCGLWQATKLYKVHKTKIRQDDQFELARCIMYDISTVENVKNSYLIKSQNNGLCSDTWVLAWVLGKPDHFYG